MLDKIDVNNIVYEDEILLMIRKGNERALELFFSYYETLMRVQASNYKKKFSLSTFDWNDISQEINICLYETIKNYNYKNGKFYTYFLTILERNINKELKYQTKGPNDPRKNVEYDEIKYFHSDTDCMLVDDLTFKSQEDIVITCKNENKKSTCLKLWMQGFSYKEISEILNISVPSVNYNVRSAIENLKERFNKNSN